jgi:hypothetical protein
MQTEGRKSIWILKGLFWGFFMFLIMAIATPFAEGIQLEAGKLMIRFILWIVVGLAGGYIFHLIEKK